VTILPVTVNYGQHHCFVWMSSQRLKMVCGVNPKLCRQGAKRANRKLGMVFGGLTMTNHAGGDPRTTSSPLHRLQVAYLSHVLERNRSLFSLCDLYLSAAL